MNWEELAAALIAFWLATRIWAWGERRLKPLDILFKVGMNKAADTIENTMDRLEDYVARKLEEAEEETEEEEKEEDSQKVCKGEQ